MQDFLRVQVKLAKVYNDDWSYKDFAEVIDITASNSITEGHGGGDHGIVRDLYLYFTNQYDGKSIPEIKESCYSHMVTFAVEKAREEGTVVDVEEFINSIG